jgi:hypothetical protein
MTDQARRIRDEAMRLAPRPDIRVRTGENEHRELTPEESERFGLGVMAGGKVEIEEED